MRAARLALALVAALWLAACAVQTPLLKRVGRSEFTVRIDIADDAETIDAVCVGLSPHHKLRRDTGERVAGCARFDERDNRLEMWLVEPAYLQQEAAWAKIGHELWHGVRGKFHE